MPVVSYNQFVNCNLDLTPLLFHNFLKPNNRAVENCTEEARSKKIQNEKIIYGFIATLNILCLIMIT